MMEFTKILQTLENTKNLIKESVKPLKKTNNVDGWKHIDESNLTYFNFSSETSAPEIDTRNNSTQLKEANDIEVESYLRKCSDLEVLYIKKHKEFIKLAKAIKKVIENIYNFYNILMTILYLFSDKECDKETKYRIPKKSIIDDLSTKLQTQKTIEDTISNFNKVIARHSLSNPRSSFESNPSSNNSSSSSNNTSNRTRSSNTSRSSSRNSNTSRSSSRNSNTSRSISRNRYKRNTRKEGNNMFKRRMRNADLNVPKTGNHRGIKVAYRGRNTQKKQARGPIVKSTAKSRERAAKIANNIRKGKFSSSKR